MPRTKRPYDLDLTPICSKKFTWKDGTATTFASDLGPLRDGTWWLQRLYNDAVDIGIAIVSSKTQKVERFILENEHVNRDRELTHWTFTPEDPRCPVKQVTIFND